jgi:hypothetical protein
MAMYLERLPGQFGDSAVVGDATAAVPDPAKVLQRRTGLEMI